MPKEKTETTPEDRKPTLVDTAKEAAVGAVVTVVVTAVAGAAVGFVATKIQNRMNAKKDENEEN